MSDQTILRRIACWQDGDIDFAGGDFQSVEFGDGVPALLLAIDLAMTRIELQRALERLERRGKLRRSAGSPWWFGPFGPNVTLAWRRLDGRCVELNLRHDVHQRVVSYELKLGSMPPRPGACLADRPQVLWALTPTAFTELEAPPDNRRRRGGRKAKTLTVRARRDALRDLLKRNPAMESRRGDLAGRFEVSRSTISRDLAWLWRNAPRDMARILGEPKRTFRRPSKPDSAEREAVATWTVPDDIE